MGYSNQVMTTSILAGEDLSAITARYHAVAFADGCLAANGEEASGILINDPVSGEHAHLVYNGECKYAAGAAITKGAKLTVTTSGWFVTANSDDPIVGEAKETATSGSLNTGVFCFNSAIYPNRSIQVDFTLAETMALSGVAVALNDSKVANSALEFSGIYTTTGSSGYTGTITMGGVCYGRSGPAVNVGVPVMAGLSGYMIAVTSGYNPNGQMLATSTSGSLALMYINGVSLTTFA